jgi:hypothetical protein
MNLGFMKGAKIRKREHPSQTIAPHASTIKYMRQNNQPQECRIFAASETGLPEMEIKRPIKLLKCT